MNKTYKILTFIFIGITIVLSIGLIFTARGNKVLKEENKTLQTQIDEAQKRIDERTVVIDDLKIDLEEWNKKLKINIDEKDIDSLRYDISSQANFLAKFLYGNDSL